MYDLTAATRVCHQEMSSFAGQIHRFVRRPLNPMGRGFPGSSGSRFRLRLRRELRAEEGRRSRTAENLRIE